MTNEILLIGTGRMARAHAAVLLTLRKKLLVIGRSREGSAAFESDTGIKARAGGLPAYRGALPRAAVIAVDADKLAETAAAAIRRGCRRLLLEKPGALYAKDLKALRRVAHTHNARVFIAYNRRFLASVRKARECIKKDGGPISYTFVFTEKLTTKKSMRLNNTPHAVRQKWFIANSTHVVDLAFHLGGMPARLSGFSSAGPMWSPHPSFFSGAGITARDIPFSYHANWELPGPWSVCVGTKKRILILEPLETLREEKNGTTRNVPFDDRFDKKFKPGFYLQMKAFLGNAKGLPTLADQIESFAWYEKIECGN